MIKKCDECKRCAMNDDMTNVVMSSADWQRNEQRHLRREKRLIAIIVLVIVLLVGSNIGWLVYESQFETVETIEEDIVVDAGENGNANYIGNDGDINNG
jgi:ABC-type Na+ efflux pump permease subunit